MSHWFVLILVFNPIDIFIVTFRVYCLQEGGVSCLYFDLFVELLSPCHLLNAPLIYFLPLDNFDKEKKSLLQRQDLNGEKFSQMEELAKNLNRNWLIMEQI